MATPGTNSTPIKPTTGGLQQHRNSIVGAGVLKQEQGEDMSGSWLGPFTPQEFMSNLMNISKRLLKMMPGGVKFKEPTEGQLEKDMYKDFVRPCPHAIYYCECTDHLCSEVGYHHQEAQSLSEEAILHLCKLDFEG